MDCKALTSVHFYAIKEPIKIGNGIFRYCTNLSKINVPANYEGNTFCGIAVEKSLEPVNVDPEKSSSNSLDISGGAIAGLVVGGLAAAIAATIVTILFLKHKHRQADITQEASDLKDVSEVAF